MAGGEISIMVWNGHDKKYTPVVIRAAYVNSTLAVHLAVDGEGNPKPRHIVETVGDRKKGSKEVRKRNTAYGWVVTAHRTGAKIAGPFDTKRAALRCADLLETEPWPNDMTEYRERPLGVKRALGQVVRCAVGRSFAAEPNGCGHHCSLCQPMEMPSGVRPYVHLSTGKMIGHQFVGPGKQEAFAVGMSLGRKIKPMTDDEWVEYAELVKVQNRVRRQVTRGA